jgi:hypothetical protein
VSAPRARLRAPRRAFRGASVLLAATFLFSAAAAARIPEADRVVDAIARANRAANRSQPLRVDLLVRIAEGPVIAQGELETRPSGVARLELRGAAGLRERHLLDSKGRSAARNGEPVEDPRAFLLPIFLLQAGSGEALQGLLAHFGIDPGLLGLGLCGDANCYVLGDPVRTPPPFVVPWVLPPAIEEEDSDAAGDVPPEAAAEPASPAAPLPVVEAPEALPAAFGSFWVETQRFEPRRLRSPAGTRVVFGATVAFGSQRFPAWFEIQEPGQGPVRFEVQGVQPSRLSPADFSQAWLREPSGD